MFKHSLALLDCASFPKGSLLETTITSLQASLPLRNPRAKGLHHIVLSLVSRVRSAQQIDVCTPPSWWFGARFGICAPGGVPFTHKNHSNPEATNPNHSRTMVFPKKLNVESEGHSPQIDMELKKGVPQEQPSTKRTGFLGFHEQIRGVPNMKGLCGFHVHR